MKKIFAFLISSVFALNLFGTEVVYKTTTYEIKHTGDFVFFGNTNLVVDLNIYNNYRSEPIKCNIKCTIKADNNELIYNLTQQLNVQPIDSASLSFSFYSPKPGFYKVLLEDGDRFIKEFNICYEPEKIYTLYPNIDKSKIFWSNVMNSTMLKSPQYKITKIKEKAYRAREAYSVFIKYPNMEPFCGYYFVPVKDEKNLIARARVLYGEKIDLEKETKYDGDCIDFILPIDSLAIPDSLFYKNMVIKYITMVKFLSSKKNANINSIFVTGKGIPGAMAMLAAAIDTTIEAAAVYNPFVNESVLRQGSNMKLGVISSLVKCPVLFGIGLQDSIATPRSVFDAYNVIKSNKEYYIFPFSGKEEDKKWDMLRNNFFIKYKKKPTKFSLVGLF
ncbi:MAG: acetylxylan esterase [Bacteroidales bacterium]